MRCRCAIFLLLFPLGLISCKTTKPSEKPVVQNVVDEKKTMEEGQRLFLEGNYRAALGPFTAILDSKGASSAEGEAAYWAGFCHLKLGEFESAGKCFQAATSRMESPHFLGPAYLGLGDSYLGQRKYSLAQSYYEKAMNGFSAYVERDKIQQRLEEIKRHSNLPSAPKESKPKKTSAAHAESPKPEALSPKPAKEVPVYLQFGAFADRAEAKKKADALKRSGFSPHILLLERQGKKLYCVRTGPYPIREEAAKSQESFKSQGFDSFVTE